MRGIAGVVSFDNGPVAPDEFVRMLDRMAVRRPERRGQICEGRAAFGHVLTCTTEEDRWEAQPVRSRDGKAWLVTDILLENRTELAAELGLRRGELEKLPDGTLTMAAWERWGKECPPHLEATASATAVWSPVEQELFCFTGHLRGALYYTRRAGRFAFATTLRALFALPWVSRGLDDTALAEHLVRIPHEPGRTLYRDIRRLQPGDSLRVTRDGEVITPYWRMPEPIELRLGSDRDYLEDFRHALTDAVRRKLRAARGVACMVSGGLDSASVAVIAGQLLAEQGKRLKVLHTLPIGENQYAWHRRELDESAYVRQLETHAPYMDYHYRQAWPEGLPVEEWNDFFSVHCIPPPSIPTRGYAHFQSILETQGIDRLLTGLGGNLVVSMESEPWNYLRHLVVERRLWRLLRELHGQHRVYGTPWRALLRQLKARKSQQTGSHGPVARARILAPEFRYRSGIEERLQSEVADRDLHSTENLRMSMHRFLVDSARARPGTPASAWGEEYPVPVSPLADRRLNQFCLSLPFEQQIRGGWDRRLLRLSMEGHLPDALRWRVTRGFPQPEFQFKYAALMETLGGEAACLNSLDRATAYLDMDHIRSLTGKKNAHQRWAIELSVLRALTLERFLRWHEAPQELGGAVSA